MKLQKEFKGVDENQMKLASTMKAIFVTLQAYIKEHHRTGLEWKANGTSHPHPHPNPRPNPNPNPNPDPSH